MILVFSRTILALSVYSFKPGALENSRPDFDLIAQVRLAFRLIADPEFYFFFLPGLLVHRLTRAHVYERRARIVWFFFF